MIQWILGALVVREILKPKRSSRSSYTPRKTKAYKARERSENIQHGFDREYYIANYLERCGATVRMSSGSRGPWDIRANWGHSVWHVQAKSSRYGNARWPPTAEIQRLIRSCSSNEKPVVALSEGERTTYHCALTRSRLYPSKQ